MKVSLNLMQYYGNGVKLMPHGITDLVEKIGLRLGAVDEVVDLGQKYRNIFIVKVTNCERHPNADKLQLCTVDDGGKSQRVQRDTNGHVQVVCGAPNVRAGMLAVWLPPAVTVPVTADKDPLVLEARDIRGQVSNGMLASAHELGIGDDHSGIIELEEGAPGDDFAEALGLNDYIIDIENKMFTHRPDCFGQLGVARELAGIQGLKFRSPDWYLQPNEEFQVSNSTLPLEVNNEIPELVPRFTAIAMSGAEVGPSPLWLRSYLSRVGIRPINNVVDLTNCFMILTGQPIHAYDYDKVRELSDGPAARISVRKPKAGEKIAILGGKTIQPNEEDMMVAADRGLICVGGAIGGAETEVGQSTKNIIIEAATWDMYTIRRTAMSHGIFTDAVARFTKGQSPLQNKAVVLKLIGDIKHLTGAEVASGMIDDNHLSQEVRERDSLHPPVSVSKDFINERLGEKLSVEDMAQILKNVEFDVQIQGEELTVKAPFWRTDIEIPEDVVEEVGRLYGYEHLPLELPKRTIRPAKRNELIEFKAKVRDVLSNSGANEVLTYSFVHGDLIDRVGQDRSKAFQLSNALSPDLQYYRLSLLPSLLTNVHANIKAGFDEFALFEIGKVHAKGLEDEEGLPKEFNRISLVFAAGDKTAQQNYQGAPFYQARLYMLRLLQAFGKEATVLMPLKQIDSGESFLIEQMAKPFDPYRAAVLMYEGSIVGIVGEFRAEVAGLFKLPEFSAGFELLHSFLMTEEATGRYKPLSRFPKVQQDISLKADSGLAYQTLFDELKKGLDELLEENLTVELTPLDIYQKDVYKHFTFRLNAAHAQKTLTATEINQLLDKLSDRVKLSLGTERL